MTLIAHYSKTLGDGSFNVDTAIYHLLATDNYTICGKYQDAPKQGASARGWELLHRDFQFLNCKNCLGVIARDPDVLKTSVSFK